MQKSIRKDYTEADPYIHNVIEGDNIEFFKKFAGDDLRNAFKLTQKCVKLMLKQGGKCDMAIMIKKPARTGRIQITSNKYPVLNRAQISFDEGWNEFTFNAKRGDILEIQITGKKKGMYFQVPYIR